ncbi:unnamed protein product [Musa hybrid cultivar]
MRRLKREMRENLKEDSREGESRAGVGESGHEGVVGGLEIEVELAGLLLGEFVGGAHLGEASEPVADLGAALEVRGEEAVAELCEGGGKVGEEGVDLVDGHHVELDGVHGGDEVLDALSNGGSGGSGRGGAGGAVLDGGRDAGDEEAIDAGGSVEAVGFGEAVEGGDGAAEGRVEGAELSDELEALGLVLGGRDEVAHVRLLQLVRGLDDGVQVGEAVVHIPLPLVPPQLHLLHRRSLSLSLSLSLIYSLFLFFFFGWIDG